MGIRHSIETMSEAFAAAGNGAVNHGDTGHVFQRFDGDFNFVDYCVVDGVEDPDRAAEVARRSAGPGVDRAEDVTHLGVVETGVGDDLSPRPEPEPGDTVYWYGDPAHPGEVVLCEGEVIEVEYDEERDRRVAVLESAARDMEGLKIGRTRKAIRWLAPDPDGLQRPHRLRD